MMHLSAEAALPCQQPLFVIARIMEEAALLGGRSDILFFFRRGGGERGEKQVPPGFLQGGGGGLNIFFGSEMPSKSCSDQEACPVGG